jgi:hypothetical protein
MLQPVNLKETKYKAHMEAGNHKLNYDEGRKLIGTLDVARYISISRDGQHVKDSIHAGFKAAKNEIGEKLMTLKDEPHYIRGNVSLNVKDLIQKNSDNSSPLLDRLMETLIKDDSSVYTALCENPDHELKVHLGELRLLQITDVEAEPLGYKYQLTAGPDGAFVPNAKGKENKWRETKDIKVDDLDNKEIKQNAQDKLENGHKASIYVKLDKDSGNLNVTGFDHDTGEQYNATITRASVVEAQKKAAEAAAKALADKQAADEKVFGDEFSRLGNMADGIAEFNTDEAARAAEMQAARDQAALDKVNLPSFDNQIINTNIESPRGTELLGSSKGIERSTSMPDMRMSDDSIVDKPLQRSASSPAALSGSESLVRARSESGYSVLNNSNFIEKHGHRTSDKRALIAIGACIAAGVTLLAVGGGVIGSEAAQDANAADNDLQDAQDNNPDTVAQDNIQAEQGYANAYNTDPSNPGMVDPGKDETFINQDTGRMTVLAEPTVEGQNDINTAEVIYGADIADANEKMAEHDKLLKKDLGEGVGIPAGLLFLGGGGTAVTKYSFDRLHDHSGKHIVDGASPINVA